MSRPNKYGAQRTIIDDTTFASAKEARRYQDLLLLQRAGEIHSLCLQPRYPIKINGVKVCDYVADFAYTDRAGVEVVEDVKGVLTPVFSIKRKLMKAVHGIEVLIT